MGMLYLHNVFLLIL